MMTEDKVMAALAAGRDRAAELGMASSLAVLDEGGQMLGFLRRDGASFGTGDVARRKAYTAAAMHMPTAGMADLAQPGAPFWGLAVSGAEPFVLFPGGVPVTVEGRVVGAVGVSGGTPDSDIEIANVMLAVLQG